MTCHAPSTQEPFSEEDIARWCSRWWIFLIFFSVLIIMGVLIVLVQDYAATHPLAAMVP